MTSLVEAIGDLATVQLQTAKKVAATFQIVEQLIQLTDTMSQNNQALRDDVSMLKKRIVTLERQADLTRNPLEQEPANDNNS